MSTQHKIFSDRFSDILTIRKDFKFCNKNLLDISPYTFISKFGTGNINFHERIKYI